MQKKKLWILILTFLGIMIAVIVSVLSYKKYHISYDDRMLTSSSEEDVTRYQWIEMLDKKYGMTEATSDTPAFTDVEQSNEYFTYVQAAAQWEVIESADTFDGDTIASGYFLALTTMKAIGQDKLQIYLDTTKELTEKDYIRTALDLELITRSDMYRGFSKEECQNLLDESMKLYKGELWKADVIAIDYQDGVSEEDALNRTDDPLEDLVKTAVISQKQEITFGDIIASYGLNGDVGTNQYSSSNLTYVNQKNMDSNHFIKTKTSESRKYQEGVSFEISTDTDTGEMNLTITENTTGVAKTIRLLEGDDDKAKNIENIINAKITMSNIYVGYQTKYSHKEGVEYADAYVSYDAAVELENKLSAEKVIPLFTMTVGADKAAGMELQINLVCAVDGSASLEASLPLQPGIRYEKGKGMRYYIDISESPKVSIQLSAEGKMLLRGELVPWIAWHPILDFEVDAGATGEAAIAAHSNGQICASIETKSPYIGFQLTGDGELKKDTLLKMAGVSWEKELDYKFFGVKQAEVGFHFEEYADGTSKFVDDCTWEDDADKYYQYEFPTYFQSEEEWKEEGDYYTVTGDLYSEAWMSVAEFEAIPVGDTFTLGQETYKKGELMNQDDEYFEERDVDISNSNVYRVTQISDGTELFMENDRTEYEGVNQKKREYYVLRPDLEYDEDMFAQKLETDYEMKIEKNVLITKYTTLYSILSGSNQESLLYDRNYNNKWYEFNWTSQGNGWMQPNEEQWLTALVRFDKNGMVDVVEYLDVD